MRSGNYPFFEAFSPPIRCISRGRNIRASSLTWKRSTSAIQSVSLSESSRMDVGSLELQHGNSHEARPCPSSKRVRSGPDKLCAALKTDLNLERPDEKCNSHAGTANLVLLVFFSLLYIFHPEYLLIDRSIELKMVCGIKKVALLLFSLL